MRDHIEIKGARVHNLKNIDVLIPHKKFTVITGLSGSGKSSLAFDTLYAEGQRRYIESLSSYARQFLGKLDKPETDYIKGISPAIAIEQKVTSNNPRSTVGTSTEIYDYLKVLFARAGRTFSPISNQEVRKHQVSDVVNFLKKQKDGERAMIMCPLPGMKKYGTERELEILKQQGFVRLWINGEVLEINDIIENITKNNSKISLDDAFLIIDRITIKPEDEEFDSRISDSIQISFVEGGGNSAIYLGNELYHFNNRFELDGMEFQEPSVHFFTFNNPVGACKTCEGYGKVIGIDKDLVIPIKHLSVFDDAIVPWRGESMSKYKNKLLTNASKFDFPVHRPYIDLTEEQQELLWTGNKHFEGINSFFKMVESNTYKIQYRVMLSRYRGKTTCPDCKGTRLRKDANYVKIDGKSITELVLMPIDNCLKFFQEIKLSEFDQQISKRILPEIINRLGFLNEVGLGYLTLNRQSNSLSGGESQRINLATSLGSSLVGSMYILDEPSIGLHPRDTERLIKVLYKLRDQGNTVIVVEHEEDIMQAADEIIDIGPGAGRFGGEVVFQGTHKELIKSKSLTAKYLTGKERIEIPDKRIVPKHWLKIKGANLNNLKNVDAEIPAYALTCVTGVSGSGKSTLIKDILYPALQNADGSRTVGSVNYESITGYLEAFGNVQFIDQNPIGKSSRSNPATYVKAYDDIRELYSKQPLAKLRNYTPGFFSFNVDGGRCEVCEGEGEITIGMQFMADVHLKCEACDGTRFKMETLEVNYREKNIADILQMDVAEAVTFFGEGKTAIEKKILDKILPFQEVGLDYMQLGQSSSTLSGGEAQRVKLASFLYKGKSSKNSVFIFDEPTTGLHFHDVAKLIMAFQALIREGATIIVIEHNMDVIKCADYILDMGPEGGINGGKLVFSGTPEELAKEKDNYTGKYLKEKLVVGKK